MPIIESTVGPDGQAINVVKPWTEAALLAWIDNERQAREAAGITVGTRFIATVLADQPKLVKLAIHAERVLAGNAEALAELELFGGVYAYKPTGAVWCYQLTPAEVVRIAKCVDYYIAHCQAVEGALQRMITEGTPLEAVANAAPSLWHNGSFAEHAND